MNRNTSEMCMINEEDEFINESSKKVKDKTYRIGTFKDVPYISKGNKIRKVRSRSELVSKFILFFVLIEQVAITKEIGKTVTQNDIQKGNLPSQYLVEQSDEEIIREQIDEEIIRAYDCIEESMSNAEISLNPPSECRIEDESAYHRPIKKRAQILERVRTISIEDTTCVIQWRVNVCWCGGEFAIENYMHADLETLRSTILP